MEFVGSGPAATHFLCFAKESKQRKATTLPLAFGFPIVRVKKWESLETRLRLKHKAFLIHFLPRTIGSVRSGLKSKAKAKAQAKAKAKAKAQAKATTVARNLKDGSVCVPSFLRRQESSVFGFKICEGYSSS